jgi:DNA-binding LacI/PurR family transcriptional regulator
MLIGVVLFDLYNEFFSKLAMSFVNVAKRLGYSVIFQFSNKDEKAEKNASKKTNLFPCFYGKKPLKLS